MERRSAPVPLGADDQAELAAHFCRQHGALDALGVPLFSALSAPAEAGELEAADIASRLTLPLSAPGWRRVWVARPDGGLIAAHLVLRGADLVPALHRARVSLGVEPGFQRQGLGESLLRAAIAFAADSGLAWLELWVFGHNAAAIALYRKLGFAEAGRTVDQFRVGGQSIDDLTMTLALRL
jgi:ribosomal protein S18 acetylase RimI-like enzyme